MDYATLRHLEKLALIAGGGTTPLDPIERAFIAYTRMAPAKLILKKQKRLSLGGDKEMHAIAIWKALGISNEASATENRNNLSCDVFGYDTSGDVQYIGTSSDVIVSFGMGQIHDADICHPGKVHILPLLEHLYSAGAGLIRDYTLHEGLGGRISHFRGRQNLSDIVAEPENFLPGPFTSRVVLETPNASVRNVSMLCSYFEHGKQTPMESLLDSASLNAMMQSAQQLRARLGALSRYVMHKDNSFEIECNSLYEKYPAGERYHFFIPKIGKNVIVFFGDAIFHEQHRIPRDMIVLDGSRNVETLRELIRLGLYLPSAEVCKQRAQDLNQLVTIIEQSGKMPIVIGEDHYKALIVSLRQANQFLEANDAPGTQVAYVQGQQSHHLEYIVRPYESEPLLEQLLPRLSWNKHLRKYHDCSNFIKAFALLSGKDKVRELENVRGSIIFNHEQNLYVNQCLKKDEAEACSEAKIEFETRD